MCVCVCLSVSLSVCVYIYLYRVNPLTKLYSGYRGGYRGHARGYRRGGPRPPTEFVAVVSDLGHWVSVCRSTG